MPCRSLLNLMWSLNPIKLQGIVVCPSLPHSPPPPSGAFVLPASLLPLSLLFSSSSTPPKQNFFKCLIFPPLASFLQAPSHLFVHRFFIPLQPLPSSTAVPPSSFSPLFSSCLSPSSLPASPQPPLLSSVVDANWFIYLFILSLLPR